MDDCNNSSNNINHHYSMIYLILTASTITILCLLFIIAIFWIYIISKEKPLPKVKNDLPDIIGKIESEQKNLHQ